MGIDMGFSYAVEDKSRFQTPELAGACLVDLFEAPDVLKYQGAFGGTIEGLKEAGFLPSFVEDYREKIGSNMKSILETPEAERKTDSERTREEFLEEFGEDWENPSVDFTFDACEAEEWAELWLDLFESEAFQDPELLQQALPYNYKSAQIVRRDLEQLRDQAKEAHGLGVQLRFEALMG